MSYTSRAELVTIADGVCKALNGNCTAQVLKASGEGFMLRVTCGPVAITTTQPGRWYASCDRFDGFGESYPEAISALRERLEVIREGLSCLG